jgi:hypothetical protein
MWTRGETTTYTFEFPAFNSDLVVSSDYTVSGVEGYDTVTVESGATLTIESGAILQTTELTDTGTVTVDGTLSINSLYGDLPGEYAEWAGSFTSMEMLDNVERYRVQLPDSLTIDSLLWGIQPSQSIRDRGQPGVWGLVDSVSNERPQSLSTNRFSVDVFVLGRYNDFADVSDVETNLLV